VFSHSFLVPFSVHVSMRYTAFAAGVMIIANTISRPIPARVKHSGGAAIRRRTQPLTQRLVTKRLLLKANPR
jgi:hypothetical protein